MENVLHHRQPTVRHREQLNLGFVRDMALGARVGFAAT
jgi:hypothetical protein